MKKIYLFLIAIALVSTVFAQNVDVKAAAITVDGVEDEWDAIEAVMMEMPVLEEVTTVGAAYWKAAYDEENIYVLVNVAEDDSHFPSWISGTESWTADKVEIYMDVNEVLADGVGASAGLGHFQFAEAPAEDTYDVATVAASGATYCFSQIDDGYIVEYQVPINTLSNADGDVMDLATLMALENHIGFDVTIIDLDEAQEKGRLNWSNDLSIDESWNNMDGCGTITLVDNTGAKDLSSAMSIYPNPVVNVLTINASFNKVVFTNIAGQEVKTIESSAKQIDVSDLSKGLYFVKAYESGVLKGAAKITKN